MSEEERKMRLFAISQLWFVQAVESMNAGDRPAAQVARLAHDMCYAAFRGHFIGTANVGQVRES